MRGDDRTAGATLGAMTAHSAAACISPVQSLVQIRPGQIKFSINSDFPAAPPFLQLFLPRDRSVGVAVKLVPDELRHAVFRCERAANARAVLVRAG